MFRLLGFLVGSITSIVIILLLLGMPEFHLADPDLDQQRFDAAIEKLKQKQVEFESVTGRLSEDVARVAEAVEETVETISERTAAGSSATTSNVEAALEPVAVTEPSPETAAAVAPVEAPNWYSFWNPFRSEIAARGFVTQLERVTGIDYRVVRVKSGVYEVAFAYVDDSERRDKLQQIALATGLDLPDS